MSLFFLDTAQAHPGQATKSKKQRITMVGDFMAANMKLDAHATGLGSVDGAEPAVATPKINLKVELLQQQTSWKSSIVHDLWHWSFMAILIWLAITALTYVYAYMKHVLPEGTESEVLKPIAAVANIEIPSPSNVSASPAVEEKASKTSEPKPAKKAAAPEKERSVGFIESLRDWFRSTFSRGFHPRKGATAAHGKHTTKPKKRSKRHREVADPPEDASRPYQLEEF